MDNNLPEMIAPGTKSLVTVTVNKGDVQGFSKLELTMPTGFTASPAEIQGASFTFSNQKAKFVWMTLPGDASFTLSYYIESAENLEGPFEVEGAFSYVKNNKRVDFNIPTRSVIVKKGLEPTPEQIAQTQPMLKREAEVVEMICTRTLTQLSETDYIVTLKVNNNNIQGFGKILETLPAYCKTEKVNEGGAVITQDENTIKFVWFEVPTAATFEVSYKLMCLSPNSDPQIKGQLSYTENGNPFTIAVVQSATIESGTIASNNNPVTNTSTVEPNSTTNQQTAAVEPINNTIEPVKEKPVNTIKPEEPIASNKPDRTPITSVPSSENGITYKVQILAAHRIVDKTYLKDKFSFNEKFNIENHEGWVKYTTGRFAEYKDARDARVKITGDSAKLPGPFVTAYNDGERITVQEALLIGKQQWYK